MAVPPQRNHSSLFDVFLASVQERREEDSSRDIRTMSRESKKMVKRRTWYDSRNSDKVILHRGSVEVSSCWCCFGENRQSCRHFCRLHQLLIRFWMENSTFSSVLLLMEVMER